MNQIIDDTINIKSSKKRKRIQNKINNIYNIDSLLDEPSQRNQIDINVHSQYDNTLKYNINMTHENNKKIKLNCNCGSKFGIYSRHDCKHISTLLSHLIQQYISDDKENKSINKLTDILDNLNI
jgi:hypothetical protein